jgi:hypothetical protein
MLNPKATSKSQMTEMERRVKKNEMLNYFVDRRKKKKPSAMQKAKKITLDKQLKLKEEEAQTEPIPEEDSDKFEEDKDLSETINLTTEHTLFNTQSIKEVNDKKFEYSKEEICDKIAGYINNGQQIDPFFTESSQDTLVRDYVDHFISMLLIVLFCL